MDCPGVKEAPDLFYDDHLRVYWGGSPRILYDQVSIFVDVLFMANERGIDLSHLIQGQGEHFNVIFEEGNQLLALMVDKG